MEVVLNHQKLPWISQVDHLGHIIHESGSQEVPTLDDLLKYWEFSISAHHCKSNLLCKLIDVSLMEAIFGTFSLSMPVKPTDLGTLQLKFAGTCHCPQPTQYTYLFCEEFF